jgi:hypothetical protein
MSAEGWLLSRFLTYFMSLTLNGWKLHSIRYSALQHSFYEEAKNDSGVTWLVSAVSIYWKLLLVNTSNAALEIV